MEYLEDKIKLGLRIIIAGILFYTFIEITNNLINFSVYLIIAILGILILSTIGILIGYKTKILSWIILLLCLILIGLSYIFSGFGPDSKTATILFKNTVFSFLPIMTLLFYIMIKGPGKYSLDAKKLESTQNQTNNNQ